MGAVTGAGPKSATRLPRRAVRHQPCTGKGQNKTAAGKGFRRVKREEGGGLEECIRERSTPGFGAPPPRRKVAAHWWAMLFVGTLVGRLVHLRRRVLFEPVDSVERHPHRYDPCTVAAWQCAKQHGVVEDGGWRGKSGRPKPKLAEGAAAINLAFIAHHGARGRVQHSRSETSFLRGAV